MMISEKIVADLWRRQTETTFTADNGALIHVIFPGRPAYGGGCDFRDSVFLQEGIAVTGNVEVHSRLRDWYTHGHDTDPRYNDIALHVVMQGDIIPVRLHNGTIVPTISLESVNLHVEAGLSVCTHASHLDNYIILQILNICGYERFLGKVEIAGKELRSSYADAVLLRHIAAALGYSRNTAQFRLLAGSIPANSALLPLQEMEPLLFGLSGLLPSQRRRSCGDGYTCSTERMWQAQGYTQALYAGDWCFSGIRPHNNPVRRIAALARILYRFREHGLFKGMIELIEKMRSDNDDRNRCQLISVEDDYWTHHSDFGIIMSRRVALLGKQRTCDMLMSAVLPALYASGDICSETVRRIYMTYPANGGNEITRFMKEQLSIKGNVTACQQQGLIHLFRMHCRTRDCMRCPVYEQTRLRPGMTSMA